jgi:hypothetical protein
MRRARTPMSCNAYRDNAIKGCVAVDGGPPGDVTMLRAALPYKRFFCTLTNQHGITMR